VAIATVFMNQPRLLKAGDDSQKNWKEINTLRLAVIELERRLKVQEALNRRFQTVSGDGWYFADPIAYDHTKLYFRRQVVMVLPELDEYGDPVSGVDLSVTEGVLDGDDEEAIAPVFAIPGTWVALRDVPILGDGETARYHVPRWPWPAPWDPDNALNFWYPVSFGPQLEKVCRPGGTEFDLVNITRARFDDEGNPIDF
jgi:hypothetical protein